MTLEDAINERDQLGYNTQESADWLIQRVKELEEGIRKHREESACWSFDERTKEATAMFLPYDGALYKLLEEI